jgi:hypothetical protein
VNPSELQFGDKGAQNVKNFGHYNVVTLEDGKTALQSPTTGNIMPRNTPMGGEEIMRRNKMQGK